MMLILPYFKLILPSLKTPKQALSCLHPFIEMNESSCLVEMGVKTGQDRSRAVKNPLKLVFYIKHQKFLPVFKVFIVILKTFCYIYFQ